MRKQYHFRPSPNGLYAWDVDRLILLSKDLEVSTVRLDELQELDEPYWFSYGEVPTCRNIAEHFQLIREADLRYPIILCASARLMDGMHRVTKAFSAGMSEIRCVQFDETPPPDFVDVQPGDLPNTR